MAAAKTHDFEIRAAVVRALMGRAASHGHDVRHEITLASNIPQQNHALLGAKWSPRLPEPTRRLCEAPGLPHLLLEFSLQRANPRPVVLLGDLHGRVTKQDGHGLKRCSC